MWLPNLAGLISYHRPWADLMLWLDVASCEWGRTHTAGIQTPWDPNAMGSKRHGSQTPWDPNAVGSKRRGIRTPTVASPNFVTSLWDPIQLITISTRPLADLRHSRTLLRVIAIASQTYPISSAW